MRWLAPVAAGVVAAVALSWVGRTGRFTGLAVNTGPAPWPAPAGAGERVRAAHLPVFEDKGGAVAHPHVHVDVFVDGRPVTIPAGLGLAPPYASMHTHAASGIVHLETADGGAVFRLGQLFVLWGVRLSPRCTGGYCAPGQPTRVYVDGVERPGPPGAVVLAPSQEVAMVVGAAPAVIPSRYDCHNAAAMELVSCQAFLTGAGR